MNVYKLTKTTIYLFNEVILQLQFTGNYKYECMHMPSHAYL
jgi:hypothetical protein